jgi:hypothetical protein
MEHSIRKPYDAPKLAKMILEAVQWTRALDMAHWIRAPKKWNTLLASEEVTRDCGTTLCGAGWAVHLSGYDIVDGDPVLTPEEEAAVDAFMAAAGATSQCQWVALGAMLLDLDYGEAWRLFTGTGHLPALDLRIRLREIAGE